MMSTPELKEIFCDKCPRSEEIVSYTYDGVAELPEGWTKGNGDYGDYEDSYLCPKCQPPKPGKGLKRTASANNLLYGKR